MRTAVSPMHQPGLRSRTDAAKTTAQGSFELLPQRRTVLKRYSDPRHLRAVRALLGRFRCTAVPLTPTGNTFHA
jgi:hypothetical protein